RPASSPTLVAPTGALSKRWKRQPDSGVAGMNLSGNITNGIGQSVRRKEDFRLLTGRGSFSDDVRLPEMAHAVIARSPYAHAQIESVDVIPPEDRGDVVKG